MLILAIFVASLAASFVKGQDIFIFGYIMAIVYALHGPFRRYAHRPSWLDIRGPYRRFTSPLALSS